MLPELARHSEKFYYFYEIANEGSLQATARKLGSTAPSLSHAVKQLESVTGTRLFERSKSGVTLTEAGEKLFVFCRKYFRELEEVQRLIEHPEQKSIRKIKIGTFQSIALYFWPLLIDSLKAESNILLSIKTDRSRAIIESLLKREIDVALTVEVLRHEKLIKHELYRDDYAFHVPSTWKKSELKYDAIHKHAILFIPDAIDESGKSLRQYLHSWGLNFRHEFELDSLEVIAEFVKKGYGIGILPTKVAKTHGGALKRLKIEGIAPARFGTHRFFLSYRDDLELPQGFMKHLLETAKRAAVQLNS